MTTFPADHDLRIDDGLRRALWLEKARRDPSDPYAYAMAYRSIGGRPLLHLPALQDIARDLHPRVVVQKSAQVGLTELFVNFDLWASDRGYAGRGNVLVLMPTLSQMADFAQQRFDRAIQGDAYLRSRLQPEPPQRKGADSTRLKHFGAGYVFLRTAESRRQIASVDADIVHLDEFDQMNEGTLELAEKRLASSRKPLLRVISTPRLAESGINALYLDSDQRRYYLPCPNCILEQLLTWADNVDLETARVVCRRCRAPMNVLTTGRWVATAPGNEKTHGYHLSRLYSPWANIPAMVEASEAITPWARQEFFNSDLGECFEAPGGGLHLDEIDRCRDNYRLTDYAGEACVMGVDVGLKLHVVIREAPPAPPTIVTRFAPVEVKRSAPKLWWVGIVDGFGDLAKLIEQFHVRVVAIDIRPETRAASEFARSAKTQTYLVDYDRHEPGHIVQREVPPRISANRTYYMDLFVDNVRRRLLSLPTAARYLGGRIKDDLGEYYRELLAPQRTFIRDRHNNPDARWLEYRKDDHFFHAELYALLAAEHCYDGLIQVYI